MDSQTVSEDSDVDSTAGQRVGLPQPIASLARPEIQAKKMTANLEPDTYVDLNAPELYLNRELTWLAFNLRVLDEARDSRTPWLERLKFLAIVSSNLDEFFMKRIGGLKQQVGAGVDKLTVDGCTPQQQIAVCTVAVRDLMQEKTALLQVVMNGLGNHEIHLQSYAGLSDSQRAELRSDYQHDVLPLVTPLGLDSTHPFPFISNLSLNLLVTLKEKNGKEFVARVKVPVGPHTPRFVRIGGNHRYLPLEDVIGNNLDLLFPDCDVEHCHLFRVTRNASAERDEDGADDLLALIEAELRDRKFAQSVRLEVAESMPMEQREMLAAKLGIDAKTDVFEDKGPLGMADLMELANLDIPELRDAPHRPKTNVYLRDKVSIFAAIRRRSSILLQFPQESFATSVERFVSEASDDPQVLVIKATLYRTSASSGIVESLASAARRGKHVAVMVELKARFDEAANVRWARRLEDSGVHVSYGVIGLKTHCKAILVIRREQDELRRYVHVGTGNYHAGTARIYADFGLLSCDAKMSQDIADLFNGLTSGRNLMRRYHKILTAPRTMKKALLCKIDREIEQHSTTLDGHIRLKTNALEDRNIVEALYRASRAGVQIELLVRDTCRLRPGLRGLSENISVTSTISRFLEHARIYYFRNGGDEEYLLGSADLMQRNLEHRIELLVPVEDKSLRADLRRFLDAQLADRRHAWTMLSDGRYMRKQPDPDTAAKARKPQKSAVATTSVENAFAETVKTCENAMDHSN
jgi:polyphosphate kinase